MKKYLVVDDNIDVIESVEFFNEISPQYDIYTAKNGKEALEKFKESFYDVVITDQRMPMMTGTELMIELKKLNSSVKVYLISGDEDKPTVNSEFNFDGFFHKPVIHAEVFKAISNS